MSSLDQKQFIITEASITSNQTGDRSFDIKSIILEVDLFENIERPYITGRLLLIDDNSIFDGTAHLQYKGTEKLKLRIEVISITQDNYIIEKEFVMTTMRYMTKSGDRSSMILFDLVDYKLYSNYFKKFSRSYSGTPVEIINKILTDASLLNSKPLIKVCDDPIQKNMKVVVPYLTPFGAIEWLRDRCTTENGSPLFTYASIYHDLIILDSLDNILIQSPWNNTPRYSRNPFVQSTAMANSNPNNWLNSEHQLISSVEFTDQHDNMKLLKSGAISSQYTNLDISTNRRVSSKYSAKDLMDNLSRSDVVSNINQNVYDIFEQDKNDVNVDTLPSMYFHQVNLSNVYGDDYSYYDDPTPSSYKKRVENLALRNFLLENQVKVTVPSYAFIATTTGVGTIASFHFTSNYSTEDGVSSNDQVFDQDKSGDYMIYALRHKFAGSQMQTSVTACKLERNYMAPAS